MYNYLEGFEVTLYEGVGGFHASSEEEVLKSSHHIVISQKAFLITLLL